MNPELPFFNVSLRRLLSTVSDSFEKARVKILYTIILLTIVKLAVIIPIVYHNNQPFHLRRAIIMLGVYLILYKLLLSSKKYTLIVAHVLACMGLILIWSILLIFAQVINIISLQFVFMLSLSSFFLLNRRWGIFYSIMGILPVIVYMMFGNALVLAPGPDEISSPGFEILVVLNFITIVLILHLYHQAINRNIKEKEELNGQLLIAFNEASLAAQSRSDFLSTMSHELRTPLISVIGMSELLLSKSTDAEQEENLKILNFSAVSLHSLVNDILDYNKLGSDKLDLEAVSVNLSALVNEICAGMQLQAKEKGLNLKLEIDERIDNEFLITDPTRISQIIYNLVGNAIKFTAHGSVTLSMDLIRVNDEDMHIRFSVADTGIGISTGEQRNIFEPFTQASSSITRNFGGTGLGLAIVKRLLTLFKSDIHLNSTPLVGSEFSFEILFERDRKSKFIPADMAIVYDLSDMRILIAEDNLMNRVLLEKIFANWNNKPEFANNGKEATEKVITGNFDVILMDIHMPLMDGYEAARIVRNLPDPSRSGIPIIALTASVSNNLYYKIKEAGMDDFLHKPFRTKELYSKLKQITLRV